MTQAGAYFARCLNGTHRGLTTGSAGRAIAANVAAFTLPWCVAFAIAFFTADAAAFVAFCRDTMLAMGPRCSLGCQVLCHWYVDDRWNSFNDL